MQKNITNLVSKEDRAKRIREERKRLGYTQQQIADICGVHRVQWGRYERGEQGLDGEPLNKFGNVGARVSYILTGQSSNVTSIRKLKPKEKTMSKNQNEMNKLMGELSEEQQELVLKTARMFAKQKGHCEDCFILFIAGLSWLCGGIANYLVTDNYWLSMPFGVAGIVFLGLSFILIERKRSRLCRS